MHGCTVAGLLREGYAVIRLHAPVGAQWLVYIALLRHETR
jgi:hypothetical protein